MPNWVNNELWISGTPEKVTALYQKLSAPRLDGLADDAELISQPLSFWNIIQPEDKEAYFSNKTPNYRRDWNTLNWGCSYEAVFEGSVFDPASLADGTLELNFDTPWTQPERIIDWMTEYCLENTLYMSWNFLEDQGWGGAVFVSDSGHVTLEEWDIPQTHEEAENAYGECRCSYETEQDFWYEDCPPLIEVNTRIQQQVNDFIAGLEGLGQDTTYLERFQPSESGLALLRKTSMRILNQVETFDGVVWTGELTVGNEKFRVENLGDGSPNNYSPESGRLEILEQLRGQVARGFPKMDSESIEVLDQFCLVAEAASDAQRVAVVTYRHFDTPDPSLSAQMGPAQFVSMER